ncbi:MAG: chitobiase/beta-hexosaminidase C-terminal domain-containing protein [Crocinitomicaceae bacterium]|nr:chitobiase/beta-hexosaminidase C-terminal domain-containing protein [Crocinitomicaceae bacterium]
MKPARTLKVSLFLCAFFIFYSLNAQVIINEYSCSNINGPNDNFGEKEDWIELYNMTGASIDLTGYYLSDKASNLLKWQVPSGNIAAGGYKMVMCSGRNTVSGAELHPNFNIKQTQGEWILLCNNSGTVLDSIKIVHLTKADHSVGRSTDTAPDWKLFTTPTPGASNFGAQNFYEPTPVMSLAPGFYTGTQTVTITCADPAATIRYTTNGSDPTAASTAYTGPINISTTTVLRAAA